MDSLITGLPGQTWAVIGTLRVRAHCVFVAIVRVSRALVDIGAAHTVATVSRLAGTIEPSQGVRALGVGVAVIGIGSTLVDIRAGAGFTATRIARGTGAFIAAWYICADSIEITGGCEALIDIDTGTAIHDMKALQARARYFPVR